MMKESDKRDFVNQLITLTTSNQSLLIEKGFDPTNQLTEMQAASSEASSAEVAQQNASAALKEATALSNEKLSAAYKMASNFAELLVGLLGKDNDLVKEIRKMRK